MQRGLDTVARELASGEISRRTALKRIAVAGLGLGAVFAPAGVAEARSGCPAGHAKCGKKCCPKNAKCVKGKCKCKSGFARCDGKCVDLERSHDNCGACGNRCTKGQPCDGGYCSECQADADCPPASDLCHVPWCAAHGYCTTRDIDGVGELCGCDDPGVYGTYECDPSNGSLYCTKLPVVAALRTQPATKPSSTSMDADGHVTTSSKKCRVNRKIEIKGFYEGTGRARPVRHGEERRQRRLLGRRPE